MIFTQKLKLCKTCAEMLKICEFEEVCEGECIFCSGLFSRINEVADKIIEEIKDYELKTFQTGCLIKGSIKAVEDYFLEFTSFSVKAKVNSILSKKLTEFGLKLCKTSLPDVTIVLNAETLEYDIRISPVYIYGRYIKRVRNIPQTRWLCSECKGKGCQVCGFTGKRYQTSVEELICQPCLELMKAEDAVIHGAGREDIDARMLGNGRPFVVEIREPKIRSIDLKELENAINSSANGKISVKLEKFASPKDVVRLKTAKFKKKYRALVEFSKEVSKEELEDALRKLSYTTIEQFTPTRVEHRRANILRKRKTYELNLLLYRGKKAVITVEADSGLYIKELVSGDNGRTKPSLSEVLNNPSKVVRLDVIEVKGGI